MTVYVATAMATASVEGAKTRTSTDETLSDDDVFHVLQNERRRLVLQYLQGREGQVKMRDVAEQVAAWEHDTTVDALTESQRQRVYVPLYQDHLPKLDELGIVEYEQSRGVVRRAPLADRLYPHLVPDDDGPTDERDESFRWERPYLGLAGLGTVLVVGNALNLPLLGVVSDVLLATVIVTLFTVTSAIRFASERTDAT